MLELIHHTAIGNENQTVLTMPDLILTGLRAKELLMPGRGQKLHRHRVGLTPLHGGAHQRGQISLPGSAVIRKRVARFMGKHIL